MAFCVGGCFQLCSGANITNLYTGQQLYTGMQLTSVPSAAVASFSPTQVTWGLDNRLVGVRCLLGGEGTRIESRWAAADANPYLVLAGSLFAGLDGITNNLPLIDMVEGDPHPEDKWDRLASTLGEAVANFENSDFTKQAFGENFVTTFAAMQRVELAAYSNFVTDWELNRYRDII